ncbi:hypothetical protein [Agrobacterium rosae]|uniref:hypothetical protein n=1 Tax=Agrobacterium rosae TaxID=1972867 RepID=UPI003A7F797E
MLSIAKPFIIWAAYPALVDYFSGDHSRAALVCLALVIFISFDNLRRGFIIDWTAVAFFIAVLVLEVTLEPLWILTYPLVLISGLYTIVAAFSLLAGKPYTLQYARERTPEPYWFEESFITINYHLTGMWIAIFFASFVLSVLAAIFPNYWPIFVLARDCLIAIGLVVPDQYPDYYLRRKARADA